jgi:hypothetical protein
MMMLTPEYIPTKRRRKSIFGPVAEPLLAGYYNIEIASIEDVEARNRLFECVSPGSAFLYLCT